jgi:hypothetical protein
MVAAALRRRSGVIWRQRSGSGYRRNNGVNKGKMAAA